MMTTILLAVHLVSADPAPQLLVEATDPKLTTDYHLLDLRGKAKYEEGHIPGAALAEIGPWSKAITAGKADAAFWKAELSKVGVSPRIHTLVYSDDPRDAARAWWMLKLAGVSDLCVLNGGWKAYTEAKLPVQKDTVSAKTAPHDWKPVPDRLAVKQYLLDHLKAGIVIVDARTKDEYAGDSKLAKKPGHIPGAVHLEWSELLDPKTGKYLSQADLSKLVKERKIDLDKPVVTYCQGGGRAAVAAFGLELAGAKKVRNYYASWGEWGNADDTPVALPKK